MADSSPQRVSTGVDGLDSVLRGGLIENRNYMLRGPPGSGKTILSLHFLEAGLAGGESGLFINLEEDVEDLKANARELGFDPAAFEFLDLSPSPEEFAEDESYEVFTAAEVEQEPFNEAITERVEAVDPNRVVVDPLTQLRYLTSDEYQFRKQVLGFMRYLKRADATVLFTTQETRNRPADDLQFLSDGTIELEEIGVGRRISVPKFRGSGTRSGDHILRITEQGVSVFPELDPSAHGREFEIETASSGVGEIDELLNGGITVGGVTILSGPTGVGKTTLGTQFMSAAAGRGEDSVIYLFEETEKTFLERSTAVGMPIEEMLAAGTLRIEEVDALELSPQEFGSMVRRDVEERNARVVMLDGISGYRLTLRGADKDVVKHLHALGRYLKNMGVAAILVDETPDVIGEFRATHEQISYLADAIVFLRHIELRGELRKAIGVLKKRTSDYERTLREFGITEDGIEVGEPLTELRGILSGEPEFLDTGPDA